MEAYCARCQTAMTDVSEAALEQGECPSCGGQLSQNSHSGALGLPGAVGMTFNAGSNVAMPLVSPFEEHSLGAAAQEVTQVDHAPLPDDGGAGSFDVDIDGGDEGDQVSAEAHNEGDNGSAPEESTNEAEMRPPMFGGFSGLTTDTNAELPPAPVVGENESESGPTTQPSFTLPSFPSFGAEGSASEPDVGGGASASQMTFDGETTSPGFTPPSFLAPQGESAPPLGSTSGFDDDATQPGFDLSTLQTQAAGEESLPPAPLVSESADAATDQPSPGASLPESELPPAPVAEEPREDPVDTAQADATAAQTDTAAGASLPAHLQLPAIDFSLPSFAQGGDAPAASIATTAEGSPSPAEGAGAELPAHLQLPSFPQFDLPPIPGADGGAQASGAQGTATTTPAVPPRPPPPPPRKKRAAALPASVAPVNPLADLPAFGLPNLEKAQAKKDVTLLSTEAAQELATSAGKRKRPVGIFVLVALLVAASAGVLLKYDAIVEMLATQDAPAPVKETAEDRARVHFLAAQGLYDKKKLGEAAARFKKAIEIYPRYAKAHRGLAIVLAKQNKPKEAVEHYRTYLEIEPNAPDVKDVRKIIADYETAQKKKEAAAVEAQPTSKKRRR